MNFFNDFKNYAEQAITGAKNLVKPLTEEEVLQLKKNEAQKSKEEIIAMRSFLEEIPQVHLSKSSIHTHKVRVLKTTEEKLNAYRGSSYEQLLTIGNLTRRDFLPLEMEGEVNEDEVEQEVFSYTPSGMFDKEERLNPNLVEPILTESIEIWTKQKGLKGENKAMQLLALFEEGSEESVYEANRQIAELQPHKKDLWKAIEKNPLNAFNVVYQGEDDFFVSVLTTILWRHHDKMTPEAKKNLLVNLLIFEGSEFQVSAPNTLNIIRETENHILLKIGSKYLKNKFIKEIEQIKNFYEGNPEKFLRSGISEKLAEFEYDNEDNGLKEKLLFYLETLSQCGLYEFNSKPYFAYSVRGLLNLEAFGDKEVQIKARHALDHIFYMTAIGSLDFKCYPPLRRLKNTSNQEMLYDYRSVFMAAWEGLDIEGIEGRNKHKFIAAVSHYRPPLRTVLLMHDKGLDRDVGKSGNLSFYRLGHGANASCEIYTTGKSCEGENYVINAGGQNYEVAGIDVANSVRSRLTCILTGDSQSRSIDDIFYLGETFPDEDRSKAAEKTLNKAQLQNNTGVYELFMCGACPVHVPQNKQPLAESSHWKLYEVTPGLYGAVHSEKTLGIIALFDCPRPSSDEALAILNDIEAKNADQQLLKTQFTFPSQGLTSSKNKSNLLEASKNDSWSEFLKGFEYEIEPLQNKVDDFAEKEGKDSPRDAARVIQYDVKSPKSTWVIKSDNKRKFLNRDMDRWPLLTTFGKVYKNESSDLEKSGITKI